MKYKAWRKVIAVGMDGGPLVSGREQAIKRKSSTLLEVRMQYPEPNDIEQLKKPLKNELKQRL